MTVSENIDEVLETVENTEAEVAKTAPSDLKKYTFFAVIALLAISAIIAAFALVAGEWSDTTTKAVGVSLTSAGHAFIALLLIDRLVKPEEVEGRYFSYWWAFLRTLFVANVTSFFLSVFAILEVIPDRICEVTPGRNVDSWDTWRAPYNCEWVNITGNLYYWIFGVLVIAVVVVATLTFGYHRGNLAFSLAKITNYFGIAIGGFWLPLALGDLWDVPDVYGRFLMALAILATALAVITMVLGKVYLNANPEARDELNRQKHEKLLVNKNKNDVKTTAVAYAPNLDVVNVQNIDFEKLDQTIIKLSIVLEELKEFRIANGGYPQQKQ